MNHIFMSISYPSTGVTCRKAWLTTIFGDARGYELCGGVTLCLCHWIWSYSRHSSPEQTTYHITLTMLSNDFRSRWDKYWIGHETFYPRVMAHPELYQMSSSTAESSEIYKQSIQKLSEEVNECTGKTVELITQCDELDKDLAQLHTLSKQM